MKMISAGFVNVIQKGCIKSSFTLFTQSSGVLYRVPNELNFNMP